MSLRQIAVLAPEPKAIERRAKKGGGGIGQSIGAVVGGVAGGLAGGGPAGAIAGAAGGASVGSMIGNAVSPARAASTAIERRAAPTQQPQLIQSEQTQRLKESLMALHNQPEAIRLEYGQPLAAAYLKSFQNDNSGSGVA